MADLPMNPAIQSACPSCGKKNMASVGQAVVGGRLYWYRSTSCSKCGNFEEDDSGFPEEEPRKQLLEVGGRWQLLVSPQFKAPFLKVIRSVLSLSLREAAAVKFPDVFVGTKAEVEWLAWHAAVAGVGTKIERMEPQEISE